MEFDKFPPVIKSQLEQETKNKLRKETERSNQQLEYIKKSLKSTPNDSMLIWFSIGLVLGAFACISNCDGKTFWDVFGPTILIMVGAELIGAFCSASNNKKYKNNVEEMKLQLSYEKNRIEVLREDMKRESKEKYLQYVSGFENTAQKMSVEYVDSDLCNEVIEWMTKGFVRSIASTDRSYHIQSVNIPFSYCVFFNKITCNLGTYDFEIKRFKNLESPLEQTALAKAIAVGIQFHITLKYPKDESGTDVITNIKYSYGKDYVQVVIVYSAINGNYRLERE